MAEAVLRTERLILRPAAADDLGWILDSINTPAMLQYLGGEVRSETEVAESLEADITAFDAPCGHQRWTVFGKDSGERLGRLGLFYVRSDAAPDALRGQREIGWMFAERHWGRGYATEAAGAVLDWAFGPAALSEVFSQTSDSNAASTRVMHRLGLAPRADLAYVDPDYPAADNPTTVWSTTAEQWKRRRA